MPQFVPELIGSLGILEVAGLITVLGLALSGLLGSSDGFEGGDGDGD